MEACPEVYVLQDKIHSKEELEKTIIHELYGHVGLRSLFAREIWARLNRGIFIGHVTAKGKRDGQAPAAVVGPVNYRSTPFPTEAHQKGHHDNTG